VDANRSNSRDLQTLFSPVLHRASICIWSESLGDVAEFNAWLNRWRDQLTFVSENYGCGCCVHLYDLEGPPDIIATIPRRMRTTSEWTEELGPSC
jgi:hypothetical protein